MIYPAVLYSIKLKFPMTNFPQIFLGKSFCISLEAPGNITVTVNPKTNSKEMADRDYEDMPMYFDE